MENYLKLLLEESETECRKVYINNTMLIWYPDKKEYSLTYYKTLNMCAETINLERIITREEVVRYYHALCGEYGKLNYSSYEWVF